MVQKICNDAFGKYNVAKVFASFFKKKRFLPGHFLA
jgi:hypothetical protein